MKQHLYRITLDHLATPKEAGELHAPLTFDIGNHDDLFPIIERQRQFSGLDEADATALALGMKLLGEVLLTHRDDPFYGELRPHMREIIQAIKGRSQAGRKAQEEQSGQAGSGQAGGATE